MRDDRVSEEELKMVDDMIVAIRLCWDRTQRDALDDLEFSVGEQWAQAEVEVSSPS